MQTGKAAATIIGIGLALALAAAWFEPTQTVPAWLGQDAFLAGRPTRYWVRQLQGEPNDRAAALETFENAGDESLVVLSQIYRSSPGSQRAELRWTALELLAKKSPLPPESQAVILQAVNDNDPHVQSVAIAAVPKCGIPAERAVPALKELLTHEHAVVSARALSEYRASAVAALPALVAALHDPQLSTEGRWNAARTIGKIGPAAVSAVPDLIAELDNPEPTIREHAAEAIGDIGPLAAEQGVPALRRALADDSVKVRRDAVRSLGYIGEAARPAAEDMRKLLDDPEQIVREAAEKALQTVAPELLPRKSEPSTAPIEPCAGQLPDEAVDGAFNLLAGGLVALLEQSHPRIQPAIAVEAGNMLQNRLARQRAGVDDSLPFERPNLERRERLDHLPLDDAERRAVPVRFQLGGGYIIPAQHLQRCPSLQ